MGWVRDNAFDAASGATLPPSWPNELVVRTCSSVKYSRLSQSLLASNIRVLEIGCFSGNNLRFFLEKEWRVSGTELNDEMVALCQSNLQRLGIPSPEIRVGENHSQPWQDASFDLVVSINTIHYSSGDRFLASLKEFRRLLEPGGLAIVQTVSPEHDVHRRSERIDELQFVWGAGGFRDGEIMGFVDSAEHFRALCLEVFDDCEIFETREFGPNTSMGFLTSLVRK